MKGVYLGVGERPSIGVDVLTDAMQNDHKLSEENMNKVIAWLDANTDKKTGKLREMNFLEKSNINTILIRLGIGVSYLNGNILDLKNLLRNYVEEKKSVEKQTQTETKYIKAEKKKIKYDVNSSEKEIVFQDEESIYEEEKRKDVDIKNIDTLIRKIQKALDEGGFTFEYEEKVKSGGNNEDEYETRSVTIKNKEELARYITGFGSSVRMRRIAKHFGYTDSRGFFTKLFSTYNDEAEVILSRMKNIKKLGSSLSSSNEKTKTRAILEYMSDINSDGIIRVDTRDGVEEIRILDYVRNTTDIKNLLTNLGFSADLNQFTKMAFKETFNDRLIEPVKMGVPFEVLTKKGGYKEFMNEYLVEEAKLRRQVEEEVKRQDKKLIQTLREKAKANKNIKRDPNDKELEIARTLTIGASFGHLKAIGARVDISKLVGGIIDGLSVGGSGDGIGIALDKNIIKKQLGAYGIRVDGLLTPKGFGVSGAVNRDIFNEINDNNLNVTAGVLVGPGHTGYMLTFKEKATDNVDGINSIMKRDSKVFDSVMGLVEKGVLTDSKKLKTSYLNSLFNTNIVGQGLSKKQANIARENIQEIINKYNALIKPLDGNKKLATEHFKKAMLANMMNKMYEGQAKGLKLTGVGGFLIPGVIGGVFPIFEYNWTTFNKRNDKIAEGIAKKVTSMPLADFIKKYGDTQGTNYLRMEGDSLIIKKDSVNYTLPENGIKITEKEGYIKISPEKGYNLDINGSQYYRSDVKKDGVSKIYSLDIKSQKVSEGIEFTEVAGDKFSELRKELNLVEAGFTSKTRHNVKGELLNPNAKLEERWESLLDLWEKAKKRKNRKYNGIAGIGALGKTNLGLIIARAVVAENSTEQKKYIISRVNQFMKKAANFDDGNIDSWNTKKDKFIGKDRARNSKFDKIWKTEGLDLKAERKAYYNKLKRVKTIKKATVPGLSFDAASTLVKGKANTGVDVMKGDLDALADGKGKIITTEITDTKKIAKLKALATQSGIKDTEGLRFFLYKDPQGFDDRIMVLKELPQGGKITGTASSYGDIVDQNNHTATLIPAWTWDDEDKGTPVVEKKEPPKKEPPKKDPTKKDPAPETEIKEKGEPIPDKTDTNGDKTDTNGSSNGDTNNVSGNGSVNSKPETQDGGSSNQSGAGTETSTVNTDSNSSTVSPNPSSGVQVGGDGQQGGGNITGGQFGS